MAATFMSATFMAATTTPSDVCARGVHGSYFSETLAFFHRVAAAVTPTPTFATATVIVATTNP